MMTKPKPDFVRDLFDLLCATEEQQIAKLPIRQRVEWLNRHMAKVLHKHGRLPPHLSKMLDN